MAYSAKLIDRAISEIDKRNTRATDASEAAKTKAYADYPELSEFDRKLSNIGIRLARSSLSSSQDSSIEIKKELEKTNQDKDKFIASNGILSLLEPKYTCTKCRDTGYNQTGELCECAKELIAEYAMSALDNSLSRCTFESFSLDYYSRNPENEQRRSAYDVMSRNLKICRSFADSFPNGGKNLFLMGNAGLGKTHLAVSIAREIIKKGYYAYYCSTANIFKAVENEYYNGRRFDTLNDMKSCDLLILDDLGAEYINPFTVSSVYDVINTRLTDSKSTVYTTNITNTSLLESRYGEKIASRLTGSCRLLGFLGNDIRQMIK